MFSPSKPQALRSGDTIGLIALSSPIEPEILEQGRREVGRMGYKARIAAEPSLHYKSNTFLFSSDSVERRRAGYEELCRDPEVKVLLAVRGGYGVVELLPAFNTRLLKQNRKALVGFSDTTAVLLSTYASSNHVTIHGPALHAFAKRERDRNAFQSVEKLFELLSGRVLDPLNGSSIFSDRESRAQGRLSGGNLSVICSLMGTPWEPKFDNHILFLEDVGERPYRVHRMLMQLKLSGKLKSVRGVLLGSFNNCEHPDPNTPKISEVFEDIFREYRYPVLSGLPFGHGDQNVPLAVGTKVRIDGNKLEFTEPAVLE